MLHVGSTDISHSSSSRHDLPSSPETLLHQSRGWATGAQASELGLELELELEPASQPCSQNHAPGPTSQPHQPPWSLRLPSRPPGSSKPGLQGPRSQFTPLTVGSGEPLSGCWQGQHFFFMKISQS